MGIVDDFGRECLTPVADTSLCELRLVRKLERLVSERAVDELFYHARICYPGVWYTDYRSAKCYQVAKNVAFRICEAYIE
jgi:hypothetical protein